MVGTAPPPGLRVVFFGTPAFAAPALDQLLGSRHLVAGVVTRPDRPRGRGQKAADTPVKAIATAAGLPVLQPARMTDPAFLAALAALDADIGVVAAYGRILTEAILQIPGRGLINIHGSLLPRYRGAAPIHRAVIAGERETGITIMRVVQALDAGPMLATARRSIAPDETSDEVERDLARMGAALLVETLDVMVAGTVVETPQDDSLATYAHKLTKDDGLVDWTWPAERIHDLIRGLHPWPHAFSFLAGHRIILRQSHVVDARAGAAPGAIVEAAGDRLVVATGAGALQLVQIQAEGGRPMAARDFLAGHRVAAGQQFGAA